MQGTYVTYIKHGRYSLCVANEDTAVQDAAEAELNRKKSRLFDTANLEIPGNSDTRPSKRRTQDILIHGQKMDPWVGRKQKGGQVKVFV
jgi:hypothetical protein